MHHHDLTEHLIWDYPDQMKSGGIAQLYKLLIWTDLDVFACSIRQENQRSKTMCGLGMEVIEDCSMGYKLVPFFGQKGMRVAC